MNSRHHSGVMSGNMLLLCLVSYHLCSGQQSPNTTTSLCLYLGLSKAQRNNVKLRSLSKLLQSALLYDKAPSTVTSYARAVNRWVVWCKKNAFTPLPAKPITMALYLVKLMDQNLSKSSIFNAVYGINWVHRKFSVKNPVNSSLVSQTLASLRRLMAHPCKKKHPLQSSHVRELAHAYGHVGAALPDLQMVFLVTLGFSAFLRWNKLHQLHANHIKFHQSHMSVFLASRKNDQFGEEYLITVARSGSLTCAVHLLELFLRCGNHKSSQPLFCRVEKSTKAYKRS